MLHSSAFMLLRQGERKWEKGKTLSYKHQNLCSATGNRVVLEKLLRLCEQVSSSLTWRSWPSSPQIYEFKIKEESLARTQCHTSRCSMKVSSFPLLFPWNWQLSVYRCNIKRLVPSTPLELVIWTEMKSQLYPQSLWLSSQHTQSQWNFPVVIKWTLETCAPEPQT